MIELKQLVAYKRNPDGTKQEVRCNVDRVFRDGIQIGTIGRFTNAGFCPLVLSGIGKEEAKDIVAEIARIRQQEGKFGPPRDEVAIAPATVPDLEDEDDDE